MGQSGSVRQPLHIQAPLSSTAMLAVVLGLVAASHVCQAFPFFPQQAYYDRHSRQAFMYIDAVPEIESARLEFMEELDYAMNGLVNEVTGQVVQDTYEVQEAKEAFKEVFNNALNGFIVHAFQEDTAEVRQAKQAFFKEFEAATNGLITTIENFYIDDTPEVRDARAAFNQAFEDAKAGRIGAQYIPYTPEVQEARDQFFRFFDLVVNGMLYKLAPKPVTTYYIPDTQDVNQAKKQFRDIYKSALRGDFEAALTLVALEDAINNNENNPGRAAEEFLQTATSLQEMIAILEADGSVGLQTFDAIPEVYEIRDKEEEEEEAVNEVEEEEAEDFGDDDYAEDYAEEEAPEEEVVEEVEAAEEGNEVEGEDDYDEYEY